MASVTPANKPAKTVLILDFFPSKNLSSANFFAPNLTPVLGIEKNNKVDNPT